MSIRVHSEVAPLRRVLVHRPGLEILRMTHVDMRGLLFDDILSPELASEEHRVMQEILSSGGAEVIEVADLLSQALQAAPAEATADLLERVARSEGHTELPPFLAALPAKDLAGYLITGMDWSDLPDIPPSLARLRADAWHAPHRPLRPIPNLMFVRDPCIAVYDKFVVGHMATEARAREPLLVRFALRWGQGIPDEDFLFDDPGEPGQHAHLRALEGGDVLVVSPRFLLVGCSERTAPQTVQALADEALFPSFPKLERVYAVLLPHQRTVMHLDTLLTQIDHDLFLGYEPLITGAPGTEPLPVVCLERGRRPQRVDGTVLDVLRDELGPQVKLVACGGRERLYQSREQWTDGANAVCLSPGHIVLYDRNVHTVRALCRDHGFVSVGFSSKATPSDRAHRLQAALRQRRVVYTFVGAELSRARGGGRCMTMPLQRGEE